MTTESSGPGSASGGLDNAAYAQMRQSPEFERLRLAFRRFVFPMTVAFLAWYLLYVVLSAYARGFMGHKLFGEINVALVFGLLQFVSTFVIAWAYERYARGTLEPLAAAVPGGPSAGAGATAAKAVKEPEKREAESESTSTSTSEPTSKAEPKTKTKPASKSKPEAESEEDGA